MQALIEQEQRTFANPRLAAAERLARGLLEWQVKDWVTRSSTAAAALTGFRGGPLAEHVDIRHLTNPSGNNARVPLLLLRITAAGREHYTRHVADYRRVYGEINARDPAWEVDASGEG